MSEHETIILLNDSDIAEGYFQVGTSKVGHYRKLLKKLGEKTFIEIKINKDREGNDTYWDMKIPVSCLSKATFGIKRPKGAGNRRGSSNPTWLWKNRKKKKSENENKKEEGVV